MTFAQYLKVLGKRWRFIVICVVLLGAGAYFGSRLMKPVYQSSAIVQIGFSSAGTESDYTSLLAGAQLLQTETTLATSDPVLREVASHYPGLTASSLAQGVSVSPKTNTQLFEIDVQDHSPQRAAALANDIANTLIHQQTQAERSTFLYLVQPAQPPSTPVQPNVKLNSAIGLLAGLLLALALVLLFEQVDPHVHTSAELTNLFSWPLLASIPQVGSKEEEEVDPAERSENAEAFPILRTAIGFAAMDTPLRTILVTSASSGEGKSLIATNLALSMAKVGRNTLLIEADLRRPSLHERFDIPAGAMGFSNAILELNTSSGTKAPARGQPATQSAPSRTPGAHSGGEVSLDRYIRALDVPNLRLMPSGPLPPNPTELLDSKGMRRFLGALDDCKAEVVIFDAPRVLGLPDASILASKLDGTLLVVDVTASKKGDLKQVKAILEQARANVLGCVVNSGQGGRDRTFFSPQRPGTGKGHLAQDMPESMKAPHRALQQEVVPDAAAELATVPLAEVGVRPRKELNNGKVVHTSSAQPEPDR